MPCKSSQAGILVVKKSYSSGICWLIKATYLFIGSTFTVFTGYRTVGKVYMSCSFPLLFIGAQRKTWTKTARDQVPKVGVGVHTGVVGVALWMWENTTRGLMSAKIMQIQGNISDFSGIMCLQHICFYLRVSFSDSSSPPYPPSPLHSASSVIIRIQFLCAIFHLITDLMAPHVSCRQNWREMKWNGYENGNGITGKNEKNNRKEILSRSLTGRK